MGTQRKHGREAYQDGLKDPWGHRYWSSQVTVQAWRKGAAVGRFSYFCARDKQYLPECHEAVLGLWPVEHSMRKQWQRFFTSEFRANITSKLTGAHLGMASQAVGGR